MFWPKASEMLPNYTESSFFILIFNKIYDLTRILLNSNSLVIEKISIYIKIKCLNASDQLEIN